MRSWMRWPFVLCLVLGLVAAGAARAEDADEAEDEGGVPAGPSWTAEGTASFHTVSHAYFSDAIGTKTWQEGFTKVRGFYGLPSPTADVWFSVGGVVMGTANEDYYGTKNQTDGRVDQLAVGVSKLGNTGLSAVLGRQDIIVGDGFLIGDGYRDNKAALWNIPQNFYDGLLVDWKGPKAHALAMGVNLSRSYTNGEKTVPGQIYGGEVGWDPAETANAAIGFFTRHDTEWHPGDAHALSLRGSYGVSGLTASGEVVFQSGKFHTITRAGRGGHAALAWASEARFKPTVKLEYFMFSGEDSTTADKSEVYDPWQFRWSDWSHYYVGDLIASTVGSSSDMTIAMLQLGMTPREGTGVRLFAHRMDLQTGASYELVTGDKKAFAYEYDLVVDQALGDHFSAWVMGAYATPLDAAKAYVGDKNASQVFASVSFKFAGPAGD